MDFMEYFKSGEEQEEFTDITPELPETDSDAPKTIDEGLVDVVFQNLRTNTKVSVSGPIILFRWEWVSTKTIISIRVRKNTFKAFVDWMNRIVDYSEDSGK